MIDHDMQQILKKRVKQQPLFNRIKEWWNRQDMHFYLHTYRTIQPFTKARWWKRIHWDV